MWDSTRLRNLLEMSEQGRRQLETQMQIFTETMDGTIATAPKEHQDTIRRVKEMSGEAIAKARNGDTQGANEIINKIKDECKNHK